MQDITQTGTDHSAEIQTARAAGESAAASRQAEARACMDTMNQTMATFQCDMRGGSDG